MAIDITKTSKQVAISKSAYSDLDILFRKHPQTNHYERPFKPGFGGSIRELLFDLTTDRKLKKVQERIRKMLITFEPRIENVRVSINDVGESNEVRLGVNYSITNGVSNQSMEMTLTRAR